MQQPHSLLAMGIKAEARRAIFTDRVRACVFCVYDERWLYVNMWRIYYVWICHVVFVTLAAVSSSVFLCLCTHRTEHASFLLVRCCGCHNYCNTNNNNAMPQSTFTLCIGSGNPRHDWWQSSTRIDAVPSFSLSPSVCESVPMRFVRLHGFPISSETRTDSDEDNNNGDLVAGNIDKSDHERRSFRLCACVIRVDALSFSNA